jgi:hypothetical protein
LRKGSGKTVGRTCFPQQARPSDHQDQGQQEVHAPTLPVRPQDVPPIRAVVFVCRPTRARIDHMTKLQTEPVAVFTAAERNYICGELDLVFSTLPTVAEGFQLETWRGGPDAGKPKLSPIARALVRLDATRHEPTPAPAALHRNRACRAVCHDGDRQLADPKKFAHVRRELGIDLADHETAIGCAETKPEIT